MIIVMVFWDIDQQSVCFAIEGVCSYMYVVTLGGYMYVVTVGGHVHVHVHVHDHPQLVRVVVAIFPLLLVLHAHTVCSRQR